jgi:hypothetical protein
MDLKIVLLITFSCVYAYADGKNVVYKYVCFCIVKLK